MGGGDEEGKWICILRLGVGTGLSLPSSDLTGRRMCHQCLDEFDRGQIGCSCGGVAAKDVESVYERYITVDETRSCLVLGVDIKPVMADKYIELYLDYVKSNSSSGGKKERGGGVERIWCFVVGNSGGGGGSDAPVMTFPEWMVWYERAVFRSSPSYSNMMNGISDLGVRMDRLWRTGERYADEIAEINGGMTGEERGDMIEICKVAVGLFGFFNVVDRSRRFEECVSLR